MATAVEWDDALSLFIALLAFVLFLIAAKGYRRTPTTRVLFFVSAFAVFFGKGLLKLVEILWTHESAVVDALELVADAAILVLFFLGMTRP